VSARENSRPPVEAPWWIRAPYILLCAVCLLPFSWPCHFFKSARCSVDGGYAFKWVLLEKWWAHACTISPQMLDIIFKDRPIQRFWFLETVARMPYFSYPLKISKFDHSLCHSLFCGTWECKEMEEI
jgi:hypothetical protein